MTRSLKHDFKLCLLVFLFSHISWTPSLAGKTAQESPEFVKSRTPVLDSTQPSNKSAAGGRSQVLNNVGQTAKIRLKVEDHVRNAKRGQSGEFVVLEIWVQNESQMSVRNLSVKCRIYNIRKETQSGKNGFDNVARLYKHYQDQVFYEKQWPIAEFKKFLDSWHGQTDSVWFDHDQSIYYAGYEVSVYDEKGRLIAQDRD